MNKWSAIVAKSEDGIIGVENRLPWNIAEEKEFFRRTTSGKNLLMGRKTFESISVIDEKSVYIILTHNLNYIVNRKNCIVVHNTSEILNNFYDKELWICGGKEIYLQFIKYCSEVFVSTIKGKYEGNIKINHITDGFVKETIIINNNCFITEKFIRKKEREDLSRFDNVGVLMQAYKKYSIGARNGVVGHHVNYPLFFENTSDINSYIDQLKANKDRTVNLYIHWPYCCLPNGKEKCDFCMCNTKNSKEDNKLKNKYFECILLELEKYSELVNESNVGNIYIGGGTPMSMTGEMLDRIFTIIEKKFNITEETLISIETRPEFALEDKIEILSKHNVKKVSIGVENFNSDMAVKMGRNISGKDYYKTVKRAVDLLRKKGIEFINIDLIYGHPGEKEEFINESMEKVISVDPDSIAYYAMGLPYGCTKIEKNEQYINKWKSIDYRNNQYKKINNYFSKNGYKQIVESIWVRNASDNNVKTIEQYPNGLNNTCYLASNKWIGIGVGSIGFVEDFGQTKNLNDINEYIKVIKDGYLPIDIVQKLDRDELIRNYIILGLLHNKIDKKSFELKYGKSPEQVFKKEFEILMNCGDIIIDDSAIYLKRESINTMEGICRLFFSKKEEMDYREKERDRIDYKFYNVSYNDIQ